MNDAEFRQLVDEVRERTDLVRLVGADVDLRPAGSVLKGLSPFRRESEPSFVLWPHSQHWHDFSGGGSKGGDCIDYVIQRDGVGFMDALRRLAVDAGVDVPGTEDRALAAELERISERRRIETLLTSAAAYYHGVLPSKVREEWYRRRYAFTDETTDRLQLGWADGHLHELLLGVAGATRDEALATGLFVRMGDGGLKDFFVDRLVFPYWRRGRVVYFIARATEHTGDEPWEQAKYKKLLTRSDRHPYVSTLVGNDTFYNEDAARGAEELLITEGVTDCISAMQAGVPCISPVTVRFRRKDVPKLLDLTRRTARVVVCNDSEASGAGDAGAEETARELHAAGRDVRIATIPRPDGKEKIDVNELVAAGGPDALRDVIRRARRYPEYLLSRIPADTPKADLGDRLRPLLDLIRQTDPLLQEAYADLIRDRFRIKAATVRALLRPGTAATSPDESHTDDPGSHDTAVKGEVFEDTDHYYVLGRRDEPVMISSFAIEPTQRILVQDGEVIDGDVTTTSGHTYRGIRFSRDAWHSKRNFLKVLKPVDLQWTGSDENVQGVLRLLARRAVPTKRGTLNLGYLATPEGTLWVTPEAVIAPHGSTARTDEVVFVETGDPLSDRVRLRTDVTPDVAAAAGATVLPNLLRLNTLEVMLPIIGWFFAAPLKPRLHKLLGHFPVLCVWGTQGSGKSSLIMDVLWPLFGVASSEPYSATETEFALLKLLSATDSVPVFIDEYKPFDMPRHRRNTLHRYMRRLYTGEVEGRGRADQTVVSYRLAAPLCLAGETRPIEPALVERIITANPNKEQLLREPAHAEAFRRVKTVDPGLLAPGIIRHLLARDTKEDLAVARRVVEATLGAAEVPHRFRDNLAAVVAGLIHFEGYAESLGITLPDLDIAAFVAAQKADLLESGGTAVKTGLDYFLETLSSLAISGELQHGRQYYYSGGVLALHVPSCHAAYAEHCRRTGFEGEVVDKKALVRQLQEEHQRGGYVVAVNKPTSFGSRTEKRRATHVDLERAKATLDVDDFPQPDPEPSGGRGWDPD